MFLGVNCGKFIVGFSRSIGLCGLPHTLAHRGGCRVVLGLCGRAGAGRTGNLFVGFNTAGGAICSRQEKLTDCNTLGAHFKGRLVGGGSCIGIGDAIVSLGPLAPRRVFVLLAGLLRVCGATCRAGLSIGSDRIRRCVRSRLGHPKTTTFLAPQSIVGSFVRVLSLRHRGPSCTFSSVLTSQFNEGTSTIIGSTSSRSRVRIC